MSLENVICSQLNACSNYLLTKSMSSSVPWFPHFAPHWVLTSTAEDIVLGPVACSGVSRSERPCSWMGRGVVWVSGLFNFRFCHPELSEFPFPHLWNGASAHTSRSKWGSVTKVLGTVPGPWWRFSNANYTKNNNDGHHGKDMLIGVPWMNWKNGTPIIKLFYCCGYSVNMANQPDFAISSLCEMF